VYNVFIQNYL